MSWDTIHEGEESPVFRYCSMEDYRNMLSYRQRMIRVQFASFARD